MPFTPENSVTFVSLSKSKEEEEQGGREWVIADPTAFAERLIRKPGPPIFQLGGKSQDCVVVTDSFNTDLYRMSPDATGDLIVTKTVDSKSVQLLTVNKYEGSIKRNRSKLDFTWQLPDKVYRGKVGDFFSKGFLSSERTFKTSSGKYKWGQFVYTADGFCECPMYWQLKDDKNQVLASTERLELMGKDGKMKDSTERHPIYITEAALPHMDVRSNH